VTFHGPGQLVCYPIFDLSYFGKDLTLFVFKLEQVIIDVLADYKIKGTRIEKLRGVFVGSDKIASVGIHIKKWITFHGFSFNINVELGYFDNIIACGLKDHAPVSLEKILNRSIPISDVKELVIEKFTNIFDIVIFRIYL
jgi:lipoate-protein ligase B